LWFKERQGQSRYVPTAQHLPSLVDLGLPLICNITLSIGFNISHLPSLVDLGLPLICNVTLSIGFNISPLP
jgi:hypothetical protein